MTIRREHVLAVTCWYCGHSDRAALRLVVDQEDEYECIDGYACGDRLLVLLGDEEDDADQHRRGV